MTQSILIAGMKQGLEKDIEPFLLPEDAFPSLLNIYLYRGTLRKRWGSTAMGRSGESRRLKDVSQVPVTLPVMGLINRELTAINQEQLYAFNTNTVNAFNTTSGDFDNIAGTPPTVWSGSDSDFFHGANYQDSLFVTNNIDPIRYNFGQSTAVVNWHPLTPRVISSGASTLQRALLIFPYKDRMVALNTTETTGSFNQRARWSQNGVVYDIAPAPPGITPEVDAWDEDTPGKGGFIDAPTQEAITGADFIKDTLIVFFERSTWQLRYTGNEILPFTWERINLEHGSMSPYGIIPFDSGVIAFGNRGIVSTNGVSLERIDEKIPDQAFQVNKISQGDLKRIQGIRNFNGEQAIWTYRNFEEDFTGTAFPNRNLVLNYIDGSWSIFTNSYTAFGAFRTFDDKRWQDMNESWKDTSLPWFDPSLSSNFPSIVAGNQQGFVVYNKNVDIDGPSGEAPTLIVDPSTPAGVLGTPIRIVSPDHNLQDNDFVEFSGFATTNGWEQLNGVIFVAKVFDDNTFDLYQFIDNGTNPEGVEVPTNTAGGGVTNVIGAVATGGLIALVPKTEILSKRFNPYLNEEVKFRVIYMDIYSNTIGTDATQYAVDMMVDSNDEERVDTSLVKPFGTGTKIWKRAYIQSISDFLQFRIRQTNLQLSTQNITNSQMHFYAFMLLLRKTGGKLTR